MYKLCICDTSVFTIEDISGLVDLLPKSRRERYDKFMFERDKIHTVLEYFIVKQMLGFSENVDFVYGKNGKPSIPGKLNFNISHSGNIMVVAVAEAEIGVDIEKNVKPSKELVDRILSENEQDDYNKFGEKEFTKLWTQKEGYIKYYGGTIADGMKHILTDTHMVEFFFYDFKNYQICVCLTSKIRPTDSIKKRIENKPLDPNVVGVIHQDDGTEQYFEEGNEFNIKQMIVSKNKKILALNNRVSKIVKDMAVNRSKVLKFGFSKIFSKVKFFTESQLKAMFGKGSKSERHRLISSIYKTIFVLDDEEMVPGMDYFGELIMFNPAIQDVVTINQVGINENGKVIVYDVNSKEEEFAKQKSK
ncbi:MAG: 4'-phosphopantetheinyl transferase superfamily protein [Clostridia bacterium]|nr:4'-phosphopantetheinyl transferase superfamily protein [Clostridia bacterium]